MLQAFMTKRKPVERKKWLKKTNANIIGAWENKIEIDLGRERREVIIADVTGFYDKKEADGTK